MKCRKCKVDLRGPIQCAACVEERVDGAIDDAMDEHVCAHGPDYTRDWADRQVLLGRMAADARAWFDELAAAMEADGR